MSSGQDLQPGTFSPGPSGTQRFVRVSKALRLQRCNRIGGHRMRRYLMLCVCLLGMLPLRAEALTVRDVLELSRAGLGEEVLLALIEVDQSVFPIDSATLRSLKTAGVSERVIVAMVRSARTPAAT